MVDAGAVRVRRNDLDWVRVLAVLLLIPFHTARVFDTFEAFYIKNAEQSAFLAYAVVKFLGIWQMPLLFLVAGASTWYSLESRGGLGYLGERLKRLMIPFVFGTLVVVPPQMYFALLHRAATSDTYLGYYPSFFRLRPPGMPDYTGVGFTWAHLWFILNLFVISLAALPLFLGLRTKTGRRLLGAFAGFLGRGPAIFLLALPFPFVVELLPDIDGKPLFMHLMVFVFGFVLMSDDRYARALVRNRLAALLLAVACTSIDYAVSLSGGRFEDFSPESIALGLMNGFNLWFWLTAILGYGRALLNREGALLRYAREAAYPFYILHQTVIVAAAYYAVRLEAGALLKFLIVAVGSLGVTVGLYDVLVRRTNATRFLFGMKRKARR